VRVYEASFKNRRGKNKLTKIKRILKRKYLKNELKENEKFLFID